MNRTCRVSVIATVGLAVVVSGCSVVDPRAEEPPRENDAGPPVYVESLTVEQQDRVVEVTVTGNLPDACTRVVGVERSFSLAEAAFTLTIRAEREPGVVCAEVLTPFEETVTLKTAELEQGRYTVRCGGLTETFELLSARR